ncbi:MAG: glycosyl hydrolase [Chlorobi bacterium]|nr:glycosyl hydrolase [Chlorobiota bacterium]
MIKIDYDLKTDDLKSLIKEFWRISGEKIIKIEKEYKSSTGAPVFTVNGKYFTRGWTEWTQGFQFGSAILQFEATGEKQFLNLGRKHTLKVMAPHISNTGVHDHGFNNISTYGNLLRIMREGRIPYNEWEKNFYELALKISGAVQARRWTEVEKGGFIYSFNGPHSLFVDTIRSCRILMLSHVLGHRLYSESDRMINLLGRAIMHLKTTAGYNVYYGEGRDLYDERGRTAHESIFNINNGQYRCPNSQQGYSGFSTWTRGLAWAMLGFAEELEFIESQSKEEPVLSGEKEEIKAFILKAAKATCDFYISNSPVDGIPYWDTGAPKLREINDYLGKPADPFNDYEPVDSSAATIGAQGLLRLGHYLHSGGKNDEARKYWQAGLTILKTLLREPYLSTDPGHQGLILHSIYHRPNGWDYVPENSKIPYGESGMWGDYHARELVLYIQKILNKEKYYTFYNCVQ